MNIVITGASGFLGKSLVKYFSDMDYNVITVKRNDFNNSYLLHEKLLDSDIIINLAGETIMQRWNKKNKRRILNSRINTTSSIVNYVNRNKSNVHLINASAIGIYTSGVKHDDLSTYYADNFLGNVVNDWENEARKLDTVKNILSIIRIGVVLGNGGGAFKKYYAITKCFLGSILGNGQQFMSFIHIDDFCNAINLIIEQKLTGVLNLCCPNPVTNKLFMRTLGNHLKRPSFFIIPNILLKVIFGKAHILFTDSQYVIPKRLIHYGFRFKYSNIDDSIKALINTFSK